MKRNKILKSGLVLVLAALFTVAISSCKSSQYGCPGQITKSDVKVEGRV